MIPLVRNLQTGYVSPQYHMVFEDHFYTVFGDASDPTFRQALEDGLWDNSREKYSEDESDSSIILIYSPRPLDEVWPDEGEHRERVVQLCQKMERSKAQACKRNEATPGDTRSNEQRSRNNAIMIDDDGDSFVYDSHSGEQDSEGGSYVDHPIVHINPLQL